MARPAKKQLKKQSHEASETVSSEIRSKGEREPIRDRQDRIPVNDLQDIQNAARVRVGAGVTRKAGKDTMEFIRVDVQIEYPCEPNEKALKKTYEMLSEKVEKIIEDEIGYALDRM